MIFLAVKYLLARPRQTLLTLLGIFLGTTAYIAISGFMLGFRVYLINQLINNSAHIHIQAREDFLTEHGLDQPFFGSRFQHVFWDPPPSGRKDSAIVDNPQSWYRRLRGDPRVEAFSPQLTSAVILSKGKALATAVIVGCDPLQQVKVTTIGTYVSEGRFADLATGGNRLVIGGELQRRLGVLLLQNVLVTPAQGSPVPFKVVGVYHTGIRQADVMAYGALGDVQAVNGTPNQVNEIAVKLYDHTQAAALATMWSALSPEKVESWDQQNASFFDVFRMQDIIRYLAIGAILVVAGFGIYNVLNMTVMQKRRDIAILRSMGYAPRDILALFFSQGLILGLSGTALGLTFGFFLSRYLRTLPFGGGHGGFGTGHLMISMDPAIYLQSALLGLASASIAGILPARAAGKLTPIEIIRTAAE